MKKLISLLAVFIIVCISLCGCSSSGLGDEDEIVLRISNWEEYIDLGDWDEEEAIELEDGTVIFGENNLVEDYEEWFYETYGKKVRVEYSTFGTNEDLYNQITLGDKFDLVCPSEYMIMKMMSEDMVEPFSEDFYDTSDENNYYINGVSPYIYDKFNELNINGEKISDYAAGYMWGTLGVVYNPEVVSEEDASTWEILYNPKYYKQISIKDSVREAYFAGAALYAKDEITKESFINDPDYHSNLANVINATDQQTIDGVEEILSDIQKNVYSFETDAAKADMVAGRVLGCMQWSGDAVYTMDQADEDGFELCFASPKEANNIWFDGWCMLKNSIDGDADKKMAAQAFINFVSKSENAVRNMYYIGYTSVISGNDSDVILDYISYNYGAEDEDDVINYDLSYFFGRDDAIIETSEYSLKRQLGAQYPSKEVVDGCIIMSYFDQECNERINRMWTNVRCYDLGSLFK